MGRHGFGSAQHCAHHKLCAAHCHVAHCSFWQPEWGGSSRCQHRWRRLPSHHRQRLRTDANHTGASARVLAAHRIGHACVPFRRHRAVRPVVVDHRVRQQRHASTGSWLWRRLASDGSRCWRFVRSIAGASCSVVICLYWIHSFSNRRCRCRSRMPVLL